MAGDHCRPRCDRGVNRKGRRGRDRALTSLHVLIPPIGRFKAMDGADSFRRALAKRGHGALLGKGNEQDAHPRFRHDTLRSEAGHPRLGTNIAGIRWRQRITGEGSPVPSTAKRFSAIRPTRHRPQSRTGRRHGRGPCRAALGLPSSDHRSPRLQRTPHRPPPLTRARTSAVADAIGHRSPHYKGDPGGNRKP